MIGVDLIEIKRFSPIKQRDYKFWDKVYTFKEWEYCFKKALPARHLAGVFAAKEAVIKALVKQSVKSLKQVEIKHLANGQPQVVLKNKKKINLSISYGGAYAIAMALAK